MTKPLQLQPLALSIESSLPNSPHPGCLTSKAFYMTRRALVDALGIPRRSIRRSTKLSPRLPDEREESNGSRYITIWDSQCLVRSSRGPTVLYQTVKYVWAVRVGDDPLGTSTQCG